MKHTIGDVVYLKSGLVSGAPPFTVLECHPASEELPERYGVVCQSTDGANLLTFVLPALTIVGEESKQ